MTATPISPEGDLKASPSSFLQTPFWCSFKAAHGWKPHYFRVRTELNGKELEFSLSVLVRPIFRIASIAYVPLGPAVELRDPAAQAVFLDELSTSIAPSLPANTLFIRFDPPWGTMVSNAGKDDGDHAYDGMEPKRTTEAKTTFPPTIPRPARKAPSHIQPPDTVILDLTKSEPELLADMKTKWRYNVRLGEKKGVTIRFLEGETGASEGVDLFYGLYLETASRDGIAIHSKSYYSDLVRRAGDTAESAYPISVRVYIAEHEGSVLASIITLFCGKEAVYLYGASSNEKRNLMPAYSLQWRAIRDAKEIGCSTYDFYGIPPTDDPSHPMHGLYRFKVGFGGSIAHRVGSYDIAIRPFLYAGYRMAESLRTFWFKRVTKFFRRETRATS